MLLAIDHQTTYRYATPVRRSTQYLRLTPMQDASQQLLDWELTLPAKASRCLDAYGNVMHVLTLDKPHGEIQLQARGRVQTLDGAHAPDPLDRLPAEAFLRDSPLTRADAAIHAFALPFAAAVRADRLDGLMQILRALGSLMPYTPGATDAATPAAEAFASHLGVCQDHAHVFAACARLLGVPARYVSGYLAADAEHVASHAWVEGRLTGPQAGWLGFDVSNQCLADGRHVKLAIGADYLDACPVRGMRLGGGSEAMQASVHVTLAQQQ
jgi:transglutaminase-like putative cysteine protease